MDNTNTQKKTLLVLDSLIQIAWKSTSAMMTVICEKESATLINTDSRTVKRNSLHSKRAISSASTGKDA